VLCFVLLHLKFWTRLVYVLQLDCWICFASVWLVFFTRNSRARPYCDFNSKNKGVQNITRQNYE
jgi:hypothetical protein